MWPTSVSTIAQTIQLAVAPVFLLAGIGGILNVVATRLARVVDRVRRIEKEIPSANPEARRRELGELAVLDRRIRICHWAIGLCTTAALLICLVVIILFIAEMAPIGFALPVSLLFIAAMVTLTLGLMLFLAEVTLATRSVRVDEQFVSNGKGRHER